MCGAGWIVAERNCNEKFCGNKAVCLMIYVCAFAIELTVWLSASSNYHEFDSNPRVAWLVLQRREFAIKLKSGKESEWNRECVLTTTTNIIVNINTHIDQSTVPAWWWCKCPQRWSTRWGRKAGKAAATAHNGSWSPQWNWTGSKYVGGCLLGWWGCLLQLT